MFFKHLSFEPIFIFQEYEVINHKVGEIAASDLDIGENANINYELVFPRGISDSDALNLFRSQKVNGKS